jgi:RES domain-containing protein
MQEAVNIFNTIVAGWGLSRVLVSGIKYTAEYINAAKDGTLHTIPIDVAQAYRTKYAQVTDWSAMDPNTQGQMRRMDELLGKRVASAITIPFLAHTGEELRNHLNSLSNIPPSVSYHGSAFRTIGINYNNPLEIHPGSIAADYRYSPPNHGGLYLSQTYSGNITEMSHYSQNGILHNCKTYGYESVFLSNLLDLTNPETRKVLGVDFDMLTLHNGNNTVENYIFTHEIGIWAESRYDGIIFPGARGNRNYNNIVIFNQQDVNSAFNGIEPNITLHE